MLFRSDLPKHEAVTRIHNIDEKGVRLVYPSGQQVVVPIEVEEIYVGIPKNRLSVTVIETICTNRTTLTPLAVILPINKIIEHWFYYNITGLELIQVFKSSYTNSEINLKWLKHFIVFNKYSLTLL